MNKPTKLYTYIKKRNLRMIDIFRATMQFDGPTINYKTLYNVVHGYTDPKLKTMKAIARALNVEISDIF